MKLATGSVDDILAIVEPMMDDCLAGANEGDHERHTRHFTDRMKAIVTPDELRRQLSTEPRVHWAQRAFVCLFRRQDSIGVVWEQKTTLGSDELINQAIFKEVAGQVLIDHCMIC